MPMQTAVTNERATSSRPSDTGRGSNEGRSKTCRYGIRGTEFGPPDRRDQELPMVPEKLRTICWQHKLWSAAGECSSDDQGDVVDPPTGERVLEQVLTDLAGGGHGDEPLPDPLVGNVVGEPIAAEQHDVAPPGLAPGDHRLGLPPSDRAGERVCEA